LFSASTSRGQGRGGLLRRQAEIEGGRERHQRVVEVVPAVEGREKLSQWLAVSQKVEPGAGGIHRDRSGRVPFGGIEADRDEASRGSGDRPRDGGVGGVGDDCSVGRHEPGEPGKDGHEALEVGVEVCVVELDVVQQQRPGPVVQELRPPVEESRVVLVSLQEKDGPRAVAEPPAEVLHLSTDEKPGVAPRVEQEPGEESRCGRLAVRSGDHDRLFFRQEISLDRLGHGDVGKAPS
jgi:hypothetical protein